MSHSTSRGLTSRTVSRAVARSRAVRARVAKRRRRTAAAVACLATVVGLPLAWSFAEPAQAVVEAAVSKAEDLADLLGQRSPGERTQDQLTKHARAADTVRTQPKPVGPRVHPGGVDVPSTTALIDLLQPQPVPVEIASANLLPAVAGTPTLGAILGSTPGGAITPGGGGSIGGGGGGALPGPKTTPRDVITPVSAVPEPGTWAMMLLGFGLIGWRARRRQPARKLRRSPL